MGSVKTRHLVCCILAVAVASAALVPFAWAEAPIYQGPPVPPPVPVAPRLPPRAGAVGLILLLLMLACIGAVQAGATLSHLKSKSEDEAIHLREKIAQGLRRDPAVAGLPIGLTVRVPLRSEAAPMIEVSGQVPAPETRYAVLRLVAEEASGLRPRVHIEDRLELVLPPARRAA